MDCLFIGSATQDVLLRVEEPPRSDRRIAATEIATACGGPGSTAAVAFQSLGGKAGLITAVGDDEGAGFIRADLEGRPFAYLDIHTLEGYRSPFSTIQVEADGKRCITCYGGCMEGMTTGLLDRAALARAEMIHFGGLSAGFLVEAVRFCRAHSQALLSVDGGNYSRETADAILPYVDVFIPDDKTVAGSLGLTPEDACRYYRDRGAKIACVTLGEKGSVALDGDRLCRVPAYTGVKVVDTTGAGDNFHGAFLYGLKRGWALERTMRFSGIYAAKVCEVLGGRADHLTLESILNIMGEEL